MPLRALVLAVRGLALGAALSLAAAVGVPDALAQDDAAANPKIAVIDMQRIMRESQAVRSIQQQIEAQRSQYQDKLSEKEKQLRASDEELNRQRTVLSSEAFQKKRRELEERVGRLQRDIQSSKRKLDKNYSDAMQTVQQRLVAIVRDIASKRDLDMVIGKATVVIVRPGLDITDQALERLNATMSSVDVPPLDG